MNHTLKFGLSNEYLQDEGSHLFAIFNHKKHDAASYTTLAGKETTESSIQFYGDNSNFYCTSPFLGASVRQCKLC